MQALAKHSGQGSGCQGCDPDVAMPAETDGVFLCPVCVAWMESHGVQDVAPSDRMSLLDIRRSIFRVNAVPEFTAWNGDI